MTWTAGVALEQRRAGRLAPPGVCRVAAALLVLLPAAATAGNLPASMFEENVGQFGESVRFRTLGTATTAWITGEGLSLALAKTGHRGTVESFNIGIRFEGSTPDRSLEPVGRLPTVISRYRGGDPAGWHERVPAWRAVRWRALYPGIDAEVDAAGGEIRLRLSRRSAWSDRTTVRLRVEGATVIGVDGGGVRLATPLGDLDLPVESADVRWRVEGRGGDGAWMAFDVPRPAPASSATNADSGPWRKIGGPPTLRYGTFLGASLWDEAEAVASDADGNLFLAGHTQSLEFPSMPGPFVDDLLHVVNSYVAKFGSDGATLDYITVFQGGDLADGEEYTRGLSVDPNGYAYATGDTNSPDFPTTPGAFQTVYADNVDAFVLKLNPDGTLSYSTFLGSSDLDIAYAIVVDADGHAYVAGGTWSTTFPVTPDASDPTHNGQRDAFIAKLSPDGTALAHSTFVGGTSQEQAEAIALSGADRVFITGWTRSSDFPEVRGLPGTPRDFRDSPFDAFVFSIQLGDPTAFYSTYLGGRDEDRGFAIAVDEVGQAVVAGRTSSDDFPITPGTFGPTFGGGTCSLEPCPDAFVSKLTADGSGLVYSGFLGGSAWDSVTGLALDSGATNDGAAYVTGLTESNEFPVSADAYDSSLDGTRDAFITVINRNGSQLLYSSYLGGEEEDDANAIALRGAGEVHVAGKTRSAGFPTTPGAYDTVHNGDYDAFAVVFDPFVASIRSAGIRLQPRYYGGSSFVVGVVLVTADDATPVPEASVSSTWTRPSGVAESQTATTNERGLAVFWTPDMGPATYTLTVDDIAAEGFVFSPDQSVLTRSTTLPSP